MEITAVRVHKIEREGSRVKGYATVTLDDCFVVRNIRIIEGDEKMFIAMPNSKMADGHYRDDAHPINAETRKMFEDKILEEYNNPTNFEEGE